MTVVASRERGRSTVLPATRDSIGVTESVWTAPPGVVLGEACLSQDTR